RLDAGPTEPTPSAAPSPATPTPRAAAVVAASTVENWRAAPAQKVGEKPLGDLAAPIAFDSASAQLTRDGRAAVRELAKSLSQKLKSNPDAEWRLVIAGHTDQRPINTREFRSNWALSAARAAAVAFQLNRYGVPQSRLVAVGKAATDPLDESWSRKAFAKNRRIELSLLTQ
ncbi:MAG: OmpA family protein, partial [Pseudomonadota bacterium]